MSAPMSPTNDTSSDDLSALAWVHEELRRSLEAAHKALRRFVKETDALGGSDIDAVDPAVLRTARSQIHQGVGALELVGQPAAAMVLRASEALVQRFVSKPHKLTTLVVDDIERASFALLDYLSRLLAGKQVSTLSLFPQYRAVQEASGADRVHPADLWPVDWQWRDLPADPAAHPLQHDAATQAAIEAQLLPLMRSANPAPTAGRMSEISAGLGAGSDQTQISTLWKLASAVFEAQAHGLLGFDVFSKRVASRLLAQYRIIARGESEVSERLAQDLLFFCAQSASPGDGRNAPRLAAVRAAYGLAHHVPVDYAVSVLGRFDPAVIAQAKKRVVAAKDAWSAVAGGEMHRMTGLSEQFALVGESLKKLFPLGDIFAAELQQSIAQTQQLGAAPPAPLAMEVATSLLYIEAALDDIDFDHPEQAERVQRLADRLSAVRQGHAPDPLEGWMEELYRRVSDRQTMGSVVQELRASLSEAEKLIDQYFRKPEERQVLIPVPGQLSAMRGVLSVLGMDHASAALLRMRDEVDGLASTEVDPERVTETGVFDRLAGNLGALGFLIDMLSVQPQMAKSLFTYDAESGTLSPVMGRSEVHAPVIMRTATAAAPVDQRLIEQAQLLAFSSVREDVPVAEVSRDLERLSHEAQAADQPALAATVLKAQEALEQAGDSQAEAAAVRGELSEALVDFVSTASDPVGIDSELPSQRGSLSTPMKLDFAQSTGSAQLAQDDEMREIFLEEAREVLGNAKDASAALADAPDDLNLLTTLRRAFHTLKGSSRMVGLKDFGEGAWACEQLYNTHLADQTAAPQSLLDFTDWSLAYLSGWVDDITAQRRGLHDSATMIEAAKLAGGTPPPPPVLESESAHGALALPPDLPSAADLELGAPELIPAPEPGFALPPADADLPVLSFELDLADLDRPTGGDQKFTSEHAPLDMSAAELHAPFDALPTEPLPLAETIEASAADAPGDLIDLDLEFDLPGANDAPALIEPLAASHAELDVPFDPTPVMASEPEPLTEPASEHGGLDDELVKVVGPLRIGIPLFNIYLNEADELSRRLSTEVAEWAMELHRPIGETPIALAHSLAGSSATVGFADLSQLARALEHAQARSLAIGRGTPEEARLFVDAAEEIRRLLHQFAAGFLKEPAPELMERLAEHELSSARRLEAAAAAAELPPISEPGALGAQAESAEAPAVAEATEPEPMGEATETFAAPHPAPAEPVVAEFVADAAPQNPFETSVTSPSDSIFGRETRFEPLGVAELKPFGEIPVEAPRAMSSGHALVDGDDVIDAVDAIDAELFPIFEEEAEELLPQLASRLRDWARKPGDAAPPSACMRTLHTLKGGARLAGAMRLGEMAHRLETRIERLLAQPPVEAADVEELQAYGDTLSQTFDALRAGGAAADAAPAVTSPGPLVDLPSASPAIEMPPALEVLLESAPQPAVESGWQGLAPNSQHAPLAPLASVPAALEDSVPAALDPVVIAAQADVEALAEAVADVPAAPPTAPASVVPLAAIDWSRFPLTAPAERKTPERAQSAQSAVRVRAPLLDRLVNQAGEVSITRSRIETGVSQIKTSLADLTENLERLRAQLRDIEFHGEVQMTSRLEAAKAASQSFDPLEFDRFTRFQELTRMMAESVNDVATVQRSLQRSLETTEDELVAQARMTRELQDDLLRTRMVEFEGLSDRLYRVVRQAAKETGKSVRLDIVGGSIEVDRGVLDRMTGAFEHLLRNCVSHGIEMPDTRRAAGKDASGSIIVALSQEGNEVGVEFRDDGAGLNLPRIREKGLALGLLDANQPATDAELANLIFAPGFSTAETITELSGRGVGMDVVRSEVNAMGGRVETATAAGQGTSFKMILPLTTAVTQVVMLRCGETNVAVPSTLVEVVRRATPAEVDQAYATGSYSMGDKPLQFFWLGALLQISARPAESEARTRAIVVIRSAQQRIALHVDEVLGNQEVVVKNLGPQLSRLPGLAGITLLASGAVALIYNPVALATLYGEAARETTRAAMRAPASSGAVSLSNEPVVAEAPLVLVVDDSLTVRRVTQRLLLREGYRVVLAKDGLDALERLSEAIPEIVLSDIEMPRMDGFDLVRNMRADARLRDLPVIMITSRIAQKHREYAAELGVDHYLGKPYSEEDLLALIARYTRNSRIAA
jgi:chemosensory pili system protein ChpA (sensor histidine kinase/response regulator)